MALQSPPTWGDEPKTQAPAWTSFLQAAPLGAAAPGGNHHPLGLRGSLQVWNMQAQEPRRWGPHPPQVHGQSTQRLPSPGRAWVTPVPLSSHSVLVMTPGPEGGRAG